MEKKPPEAPKKPESPKTPAPGARRPEAPKSGEHHGQRGESESDKAHRHRFSDGEKTTIMPLSEILKARDAAKGSTPPAVDQFPEFSYQPTVRVAIPAQYLKKKLADAPSDPAKEDTKTRIELPPVKQSDALRADAGATRKTQPRGVTFHGAPAPGAPGPPSQSMGSPNLVISGEYTLKELTEPRSPLETRATEPNKPDAKVASELRGPSELKPATEPRGAPAASPKVAPELKPATEPKGPPNIKAAIDAKSQPAAAPKIEEALPTISAPMAPPAVPTAPDSVNQVIVFFSCKGGSGATALSANVAHYCASQKKKTVLVDLDLQLGDALAAMSLQPAMTIAKAMEETQRGGSMGASRSRGIILG